MFSFLMITAFLFGQYDPKENFYDAEFFFAEEDYAEALYAFTQVYKDGFQENSNINYRIGICLLQIDGRKAEAVPYLEKAIENITEKYREGNFKEDQAPPDAYLYLGNAYRINNNFQKAIESYQLFLEFENLQAVQREYAEIQIEASNSAIEALKSEQCYDVKTIGQINAIRAPVYNPAISGDMNTLAFMGRQKFYNGVYISRKEDGKWLKPYNITPSIQSDGNQHVMALSHDGNKLLVSWADQFESDVWMSEYRNGRWYKSEPLGKPVNSKYYESHACFTPDAKTIYFTSNRRESIGGMDIFKTSMNEDGTWGELELLGENVNTVLNEENPFVSPDGSRLYFSSQGHPGIGGFDIFYVEINADGSYGEPVHLAYPLNTTDDDFTFSPLQLDPDQYLTLYAKGSSEAVDLYRVEWIPESARVLAMESTEETVCLESTELADEGSDVVEEVTETVEEVVEVVEVVEEVVEEVIEEAVEEAVVEVVEEPVDEATAESYILKPVFFAFDSYALSATAKEKLDGMATILQRFPTLELEVIGHTDAVGSIAYNEMLATKRANSVVNYLASKGVDTARMKSYSKGESNPVAINRTKDNRDAPKGRALNRRVQFKATLPGGNLIEIEDVQVPDNLKIN